MKNLMLMLVGIAFISISVLAAPQGQGSKRTHRGDKNKQDQRVDKRVGEKACPKCAVLEKRLSEMRKRIAGAKKGHGRTGRRGRTDSSRGARKGYRGKSGRGRWTPSKGKTAPKHPMGSDRLKKFVEMRMNRAMSEKGRRMPSKKCEGKRGSRPLEGKINEHRRYNSTRA